MDEKSNSTYNDTYSFLTEEQLGEYSETLPLEALPPPINYKKELIFYFFNHMLETIIDTYDAYTSIENIESIASSHKFQYEPEEIYCMSDKSEISAEGEGTTIRKKKQSRISKSLPQEDTVDNSAQIEEEIEMEDLSWMMHSVLDNVEIKFKNGNKYEGPVYGMLMHGSGKFTWANGTSYKGDFANGLITGKGELILPDSSKYIGEFLNGYRHGFGVITIPEANAIYKGNWKAGKKHGEGWQQFSLNNYYEGCWFNDYMQGNGTRQYANGSRYEGEWMESWREGKGCAVMNGNDFYFGDWKAGKRDGYGQYIWNTFYNKTFSVPIGSTYLGEWRNNMRHGMGLMNFGMSSGTRYVGSFENNLKHGPGIIICENGTTIESDPIFINDKPVHTTGTGSIIEITEPEFERQFTESSTLFPKQKTSRFQLMTQRITRSVHKVHAAVMAKLDLCKYLFPKYKEKIYSIYMPFNTPTESINIHYYLMKLNALYSHKNGEDSFFKMDDSLVSSGCKFQTTTCELILPDELRQSSMFCVSDVPKKDVLGAEEKNLRKVIGLNLVKLKQIYRQYAEVACLRKLNRSTLMIRLFLWQLFRDCKLPEKGLSLTKIDQLMADNVDIELDQMHNPFEIIYFWQFLHSLITIALHFYLNNIEHVYENILKDCFLKLLENDIYPNHGQHIGSVLFDYLDVMPLNSVYKWFIEFEQPFTALTFLKSACTMQKSDPPSYYLQQKESVTKELHMGLNAYPVGHIIAYLRDDLPSIQTEPKEEPIKVTIKDTYKHKLFSLRSLGAKKILKCLSVACPYIIVDNEIVDMEQEICFLEFDEAFLMCAQELINQQKKEKLQAQMVIDNYLRTSTEVPVKSHMKGRKASKKKI